MKKLLIVDDEDGVRALVRMTLDNGVYQIIEACEGLEALGLAREHRPDLVLLDVMLPDLSGMDVCRKIKDDPDLGLHDSRHAYCKSSDARRWRRRGGWCRWLFH